MAADFVEKVKNTRTLMILNARVVFSCSHEDAGKSCPQEINGTLCYSKSCVHGDLFKTNNGTLCNSENPCSDVEHETSDAVQQDLWHQQGSTLQDLYMQDHYDDEDDDDSDWEPVNHFIIKKWFCTNCTMDDVCHCDVLLGENPGHEISDILPSKEGLQTVLQVLKTQLKFWPVLESNCSTLQSQWELVSSNMKKKTKKGRRFLGPVWWKWGSKRFVYERLYGGLLFKRRMHAKRNYSYFLQS